MAAFAERTLLLLLSLAAGVAPQEQCDCEALRQEVRQLRSELEMVQASRLSGRTQGHAHDAAAVRRAASAAECDKKFTLDSDSDVQDFLLSGCRRVKELEVRYGVTSLAGLENLTVDGGLEVYDTRLTSLSGLDGVQLVDNLYVLSNALLESLVGLESVTSMRTIVIQSNPRLSSLRGLRNVRTVTPDNGYLESLFSIQDNSALESLAGLESLTHVSKYMWVFNHARLSSLLPPWSLQSVGGSIIIRDNPELLSITGFEHVTTVPTVEIENNPKLSSISGLRNLQHAEINIVACGLSSLADLENLTSAGEFIIQDNPNLSSLTGLANLVKVESVLQIQNNGALRSLGLGALRSVGALVISSNAELVDVDGLDNLTTIMSLTVDGNRALGTLTIPGVRSMAGSLIITGNKGVVDCGLPHLVSVGRDFIISENTQMKNLYFNSLETVDGDVRIESSPWLLSLRHFEKLTGVGKLHLSLSRVISLNGLRSLTYAWGGVFLDDCGNLDSLSGLGALYRASHVRVKHSSFGLLRLQWPLNALGAPFAQGAVVDRIEFGESQWPKCVTPHERAVFVSVVPDAQFIAVPNATWERWLDRQCDAYSLQQLFVCTRGRHCSFSLLPSERGSAVNESVFISGLYEGCGECSEHPLNWTVQTGGFVDVGNVFSDEEGGHRSICWCNLRGQRAGGMGPLADLVLRGPRPTGVATCVRGHNCTVQVEGEALESTDSMVLMQGSCDEDPGRSIVASWVSENVYALHDPEAWYNAEPTRYQLCWRAPCNTTEDGATCTAPEDRYFHVGELELLGAYLRNYTLVLGEKLSVPNIGFGVADGDRMRLRRVCGKANGDGFDESLEVESSGMVFDFEALTKERVRAGLHHLCWCQAWDAVQCNAEGDFNAVSGDVRILCPSGEEITDSGECQRCPAGRQRTEPGLGQCLECPVGQFAPAGGNCESCPGGTFTALMGSSACQDCQDWESSEAEAASCSTNPQKVLLLSLFPLFVGAFCAMLVQIPGRRQYIVDVSLMERRTIVTTFGSHGLSNFGRHSIPVALHDTGHPGLGSPFRARIQDAARLELLEKNGESINRRLDTSKGTLTVVFPYGYYHQGWPVPAAVSLPLLLAMVVATGVLNLSLDLGTVAFSGAAAMAVVCTAASAAVRWWPHSTPLEKRLASFTLQKLPQLDRASLTRKKGPERAITIGKLNELLQFFTDFIHDRTAYYLDTNILRPLTTAKRLSYAELAGAEDVEWFVSHFWGTAFEHFCQALRKHAEMVCGNRSWTTMRYWVCFCSNNQHQIGEELGESWKETSFYLAVSSKLCQGTCMVLDEEALPLTRIWCIFELLQTCKLERSNENFKGLLLCTASGVLNTGNGSVDVAMALAKKVADLDLGTARATSADDETMIRDLVVKEMGSFSALNHFIRHEVRDMLIRAQGSADQQFSAVVAHLEEESKEPSQAFAHV